MAARNRPLSFTTYLWSEVDVCLYPVILYGLVGSLMTTYISIVSSQAFFITVYFIKKHVHIHIKPYWINKGYISMTPRILNK